ncbi:MAG: glycosyltransferase [Deltaproteobacteria bacterium]|jgi:tetratricopeptide (TPR) repeat protein|nr:glycosyltransferase [Deltaproteobacteria bacterium]
MFQDYYQSDSWASADGRGFKPKGSGPTLGLAMIMKNEANNLPYSLAPMAGLVDEMVVVDTGSTDAGPEMAAAYGAKVVHMAWQNDFSLARNFGLGFMKSDFILWLDADNSITMSDLAMIKNRLGCGALIFTATEVVIPQGDRLWQKRVFVNSPEVRFEGRIHEQLVHPPDWPIAHTQAEIKHWGYADGNQAREKGHRNLQLLIADPLTAAGDFYHLYQTGRTLVNLRYFKEAKHYLNAAIEAGLTQQSADYFDQNENPGQDNQAPGENGNDQANANYAALGIPGDYEEGADCGDSGDLGDLADYEDREGPDPLSQNREINPSLWSHAVIILSQAHQRLCEPREAEEALRYLCRVRPVYGPARALLGRVLYDSGRLNEAIPQLMKALAFGCGDPGWGADHRKQGFVAACLLAKANKTLGREQNARKAWEEALRLNPENPEPYVALAESSISQGDTLRAKELLAKAISLAPAHRRALSMEAML